MGSGAPPARSMQRSATSCLGSELRDGTWRSTRRSWLRTPAERSVLDRSDRSRVGPRREVAAEQLAQAEDVVSKHALQPAVDVRGHLRARAVPCIHRQQPLTHARRDEAPDDAAARRACVEVEPLQGATPDRLVWVVYREVGDEVSVDP